eukprot:TRINITY_DN5344_c0_g3_i1.p1 TRINITY_DN5344_c0_g3~~TRINITY_DN5344_c0_g3_i1.p1  ORF type:complete len:758 (-),score=169.70 TRINITY_DN5344_c0_g3_i1:150-2351(-)
MRAAADGQRFYGMVKSWKSPWGWLECPEMQADVFAHEQDLVGGFGSARLQTGTEVSFEVGSDEKTGKPRALHIQVETGDEGGEALTGTIASWKDPWGFVESPELEKQLFCHLDDIRNAERGAVVAVGSPVRFQIGEGKDGKQRAIKVDLLDSFGHSGHGGGAERLTGTVTSWKDMWGWIRCEQVTEGDIFAHSAEVLGGGQLQMGTTVSFELGTDARSGKPRAKQIRKVGSGGGGGGGARARQQQQPPPHGGKGLGLQQRGGAPRGMKGGAANDRGDALAYVGQRLEGEVLNWKEDWGWISAGFPDDIFAHKNEVLNGGALNQGERVTFTVGVDRKSGKARALEIQTGFQRAAPARSRAPAMQGPANARAAAGPGGGGLALSPDLLPYVGKRLEGEVLSWKEHWGWISAGFAGDVFAHLNEVASGQPLQVGANVTFGLGVDPKTGKARAVDIQMAAGGGGALAAQMGRKMEGEITSWKESWGWITAAGFREDIFAHSSDCDPNVAPKVGLRVSFVVGRDAKSGKARALKWTVAGGASKRGRAAGSVAAPPGRGGPAGHAKDFAEFEGQSLEGEVVSFKHPWGWVSSPSFSSDLFAHLEDLAPGSEEFTAAGQPVQFTVGFREGKWRAIDIMVLGGVTKKRRVVAEGGKKPAGNKGGKPAADKGFEPFEGMTLVGSLTSWKENWGWVSAPELGGDIFAHIEDLEAGEPRAGTEVSFTVGRDDKGRWRARAMTIT